MVSLFFLLEIIRFTYTYSPRFPVWDQWGYYKPFLENAGIFEGFFYQQGSHFLGLGHISSWLTTRVSGFSMAAEGYLVGILMTINLFLALSLKKKLTGNYQWSDLLLVPLFLYTGYSEIFLWLAHASVVAFPLMSIMLLAHLIYAPNTSRKFTGLGLLFFFSLFTGYAFITAGLTGLYTFFLLWKRRKTAALTLLIQVLVMGLFLWIYRPPASSICVINDSPASYFNYGKNLILNFFGAQPRISNLLVLIIGIAVPSAISLARSRNSIFRKKEVIVLIAFSAIYFALNLLSRACAGDHFALAPRYGVFLIPAFLGVYLALATNAKGADFLPKSAPFAVLLSLVFLRYDHLPQLYRSVESHSDKAIKWINCYKKHNDIQACDQEGMRRIFAPSQEPHAEEYLKAYLRLQKKRTKKPL